jgi:hypothetical protein
LTERSGIHDLMGCKSCLTRGWEVAHRDMPVLLFSILFIMYMLKYY